MWTFLKCYILSVSLCQTFGCLGLLNAQGKLVLATGASTGVVDSEVALCSFLPLSLKFHLIMPGSFGFNKNLGIPYHSILNLDHFCSEIKDYGSVLGAVTGEFCAMEINELKLMELWLSYMAFHSDFFMFSYTV